MNAAAIRQRKINAVNGDLQKPSPHFNKIASSRYAAPAAIKNMAILNQSADTPNAPV